MLGKRMFPDGIHLKEVGNGKKVTGSMPIEKAAAPDTVAILLSQHVGAPCNPLVKEGEPVLMGQKIGEPSGLVGAPVHSSVSGKVKAIQPRINTAGAQVSAIVIENDRLDKWHPSVAPSKYLDKLEKEDLIKLIRNAGIVGLGGATFPTSIKLSPPKDKKIDTLILNGAECEPYLTGDHRTMLEKSAEIALGMKFVKRILSAEHAYIAIEGNKPDAVQAMQRACAGMECEICILPSRYPQGGEKQLIYSVTGRQVPSGGLPMDVGVVVLNVSTSAAIAEALTHGRPIVERVVTVTGAVKNPKNLAVRIGTSIGEVIEQCGGPEDGVNKIVLGGPMMGFSAYNFETPITKGTTGILLIADKTKAEEPIGNCIRCASCVNACPIGLMPLLLYKYSTRALFTEAKAEHAMDCIECGICSYMCPAKLPLVYSIRAAKREIQKMR